MQIETYLRNCSRLGMAEHEVLHEIRPDGQVRLRIQPVRIDALALHVIVQGERLQQEPATRTPQFPDIA